MSRAAALVATFTSAMLAVTATPAVAAPAPGPSPDDSISHVAPALEPDAVRPTRPRGRWYQIAARDISSTTPTSAPAGRQALIRLTGPHARQRFRFTVDLPSDAHLEPNGRRIVARSSTGSVIGRISAPWAVDARGVQIHTEFKIIGRDSFVQLVHHRPVNATYPVLADPWFVVPIIVRVGGQQVGRYLVRRASYEAAKRAAAKIAAEQSKYNVDDLLAKTPIKMRSFTRANFRENLRRKTGWKKTSIKGYDAHHTLPVKFEARFKSAGLTIHNPLFGHWWCAKAHRANASAYNKAWEKWLRGKDIENTNAWRNKIENKRLLMISDPQWSSTYQCR